MHLYSMRLTLPAILICIIAALQSCKETPVVYPEGGYEYPEKVQDSNDYAYPVKDSFPPRKHPLDPYLFLMPFFDEPNISLAPKPNTVFRLFAFGFKVPSAVIILKEDSITVKKTWDQFWLRDSSSLPAYELIQYNILTHKQPYRDFIKRAKISKDFRDSLLKIYPRLFDDGYYDTLYKKYRASPIRNKDFHYTITKKAITNIEYKELVDLINKSEYWTAPIHRTCEPSSTDGWGFTLEANTPKKYNLLFSDDCDNKPLFNKACYQLIRAAGLSKDFGLND